MGIVILGRCCGSDSQSGHRYCEQFRYYPAYLKPATSGANSFANFAGIIPPWMFMFVIGAFVFMGTGVDQPIDGLIALSPSPCLWDYITYIYYFGPSHV